MPVIPYKTAEDDCSKGTVMALLPLLHMSDSSPNISISAALLGLSGTFRAAVKKKRKKNEWGGDYL